MKNALVAQSGGPSPVINASLQGVIDACFDAESIGALYAARHGIEGVLFEELIDMTRQDKAELALLKHTPAAGAIGSCRYKLKEGQQEDFERIIDVLRAHDIDYFFYIGGNDSMDTAAKVSALAREKGYELTVTGVPKTIDNDVGDEEFKIIDHTPGYGSTARYWAHLIQNINEENRGMNTSECVSVVQAMGRKTGFITASARLADPAREMPLQIYIAESGLNLEQLLDNVNDQLKRDKRCIVVVNEGFGVGGIGERQDAFGHIEYGASGSTAVQEIVNHLNAYKLNARGQATGQLPGVIQRGVSIAASQVDIDEAYEVGKKAVEIAQKDGTGYMATILRKPGKRYEAYFDKVKLELVANSVRFLPKEWITPSKIDMTDAFIEYAQPLIGDSWPAIKLENGLQRFARLKTDLIAKKLPGFVPCNLRE